MDNAGRAKTTHRSRVAGARASARGQRADPRHLGPGVDDSRIRLRAARHRGEAPRPEGPQSRLPCREVRQRGVLARLSVPGRSRPGAAQSELLLGQRPDPPHGRPARRGPLHGGHAGGQPGCRVRQPRLPLPRAVPAGAILRAGSSGDDRGQAGARRQDLRRRPGPGRPGTDRLHHASARRGLARRRL